MPPYTPPETGERLTVKFVRVGRDIFVGRDRNDYHEDIVALDGLDKAIEKVKSTNPAEVDAGILLVRDRDIFVSQNSFSLDLPVTGHLTEARRITNRDFAEQSPNHNVVGFRR